MMARLGQPMGCIIRIKNRAPGFGDELSLSDDAEKTHG